ncbi:MAG: ATP-binding protein [Chloroflexota bacterium]
MPAAWRAAWRTYSIPVLLSFVLLLGLASAVNLASQIGQPFGGFYTIWNHARHVWLVEAATPPWWPAITHTGLRYNDELVALDGQSYDEYALPLYARALDQGRATLPLSIRRGGNSFELDLPVQVFSLSHFLDFKLPDLINGLGFWLLALIVYRARPGTLINRLFAIAGCMVAASVWTSIVSLSTEDTLLSRLLLLGWVLTTTFIGVAFTHLTLRFPEPVRQPSPWLVRGLYALTILVAALYSLGMFLRWQAGGGENLPALAGALVTTGNRLAMLALGLGVGFYALRLVVLLSRPSTSRRQRHQVAFLMLGLALATPYVIIVVARVLSHANLSYFWLSLDLRYPVLAVPLSFAFVILRYQTFRSPHPSLVGVFILVSSAILASSAAWLLRLSDPAWVNSLAWTPFVPIFLTALLVGYFWSAQASWFSAFSRLFQWDQRSYAAVRHFGQQAVSQPDLARLPAAIARALVDNMELERAAVWLWNESAACYELAAHSGDWPDSPAATGLPVKRLVPGGASTLTTVLRTQDTSLPAWLAPLSAVIAAPAASNSAAIEVIAPLSLLEKPVGLLGLGKRWDEEIFDRRDLEIIQLIAQQAALFLLTAQQVEQLRQVPHQIAIAQEHERFKIAQELHDTIQQFLGSLPFYLEVSTHAVRSDPEQAEAVLKRCLVEVESAAQTVRQIRNNLAPLQLEKSLLVPLELLVEHFRARTSLPVQVSLPPNVDARLTVGQRHALYRVVQQALDNIAAHADASQVHITLSLQSDSEGSSLMHFTIQDDGCGFSDAERAQALQRGSFGLRSMQTRITALGGEFTIHTAPGAGTILTGWLPAAPPSAPNQ